MGNFFKTVKESLNKDVNQKKKVENLVFFLILLVIVVIAINLIWNPKEDKNNNNTIINSEKQFVSQSTNTTTLANEDNVTNNQNQEYILKSDLEKILSNIEGAGKVQVMITYTESSEIKAMFNENVKESTTEETDSSGGVRTILQTDSSKEVVYTEDSGKKIPITEKVIMPKIEGAIILAEGANDANIKNNIIMAVEAVTGLSTHKIQVFKLGANGDA